MRSLEVSLLAVNLLCLAGLVLRPRRLAAAVRLLALAPLLMAGVQILIEGYRWQMLPAYAGALLPALALRSWFSINPSINPKVWLGVLQVFLVATCVLAAGFAFPVFHFEPPTGPFPVGTTTRHLVDPDRLETYAPGSGRHRELMLQIWYPADPARGARLAPYVQPGMVIGHRYAQLALVKTRAFLDAPVAAQGAPFPVVLFSPSIGGNRFQSTFQMEELASHGFVVVAMDHPYSSGYVTFPDGHAARISIEFLDFSSEQRWKDSARKLEQDLAIRVADARFVLDSLIQWNRSDLESRFNGHLDTRHIGILGFSYGGATAAEASCRDPRLLAVMNVDGSMFGEAQANGVEHPFFLALDGTPRPTDAELHAPDVRARTLAEASKKYFDDYDRTLRTNGGYLLSIKGIEHYDYTDQPFYFHVKWTSKIGAAKAEFVRETLNRYTVAFFTQYLKGQREALLARSSSPNAEVTFTPYGANRGIISDSRNPR
jgi:dienelactone hydrolase